MEVTIVADSISPRGKRITTFELEYPRFIHAELMTHRMLSRNGQSSRAVPLLKNLEKGVVYPLTFGKNMAGMSSKEALPPLKAKLCKLLWGSAAYAVRASAFLTSKLGLHKQWANRPLEWQQNIKVVVTSTEWDNFFNLRLDSNTVQPEMVELARMMKKEMERSSVKSLGNGEWHLPYIDSAWNDLTQERRYFADGVLVSLENAILISVSCCAQVSYRNLDMGLDKAKKVVAMLTKADDPHLSPFEHQATPMEAPIETYEANWEKGITHMDPYFNFWSGNFKGWIQNRQLQDF